MLRVTSHSSPLVGCAFALLLGACSSGSGATIPASSGGVGPGAQPTGKGAVLTQTYITRCRTSVTGVTPPRARRKGSLGFGAINLAQRHPDVFGQVATVAGYFHVDDPDGVFSDNGSVEKANTPDQNVDRMKGLRVFLLDAGQENLKLVVGETKRFADLLINARIPVQLDYAPGSHNTEYAVAQLPALADFLETGWRP
ncbi:MAG: putative esterase [Acidimicrobiales bacterium]|nr:putative esterase [Acidimicrobiales bacterium]